VYCATPGYLEQHGRPTSVADLERHNCLIIKNVAQSAYWPMRMPDGSTNTVHVSGNLVSSSADTILVALLRGMGVGHIARFLVQDRLDSGELIELFPNDRVVIAGIYVVFPKRRDLPLKTRAFIDHLHREFHGKSHWTA
jgi:DNA-binding transcriptional LysR family regulator